MTTTSTANSAATWLAANPAPFHASEIPAWADRVQIEVGEARSGQTLELLGTGDLEQQYQAVAAARVLGVQVWADGNEPDVSWLVTVPPDEQPRRVQPNIRLT